MPAPTANTAAPGSGWRSAANWRTCWAAKSSCAARPGVGSTFTLYLPLEHHRHAPSRGAASNRRTSQPAQRPLAAQTRARRAGRAMPDDRADDHAGRRGAADRRGRPALRAHPGGSGARPGFKVLVATRGGEALALAREYRPTADLARRVPARHAGLDRAEPAQAGSDDAAHPGAGRHARRGPAARARARRVLLRQQADHDRGPRSGAVAHQGLRQAAPQAAADRRGQPGRAARHRRASRPRRHRSHHGRHRGRGAGGAADRALDCIVLDLRLPDMSGFDLLEAHPRRRRARRYPGHRLHRPRAVARGGCAAAYDGAQRRRQGRRVAGAAARRDRAVPAPRRRGTAATKSSA